CLDIDGKATTESSTDVCTPVAGAPSYIQADGNHGIDNSFGANVLPLIVTSAGSDFTTLANQAVTLGNSTMMFRIQGLGSGPSYSPLPGDVLRATPTDSPPQWNGGDVRDVDSLSVDGGIAS